MTYELGKARVSKATQGKEDLVRQLLHTLHRHVDKTFKCSSIQINTNTVSEPQKDQNNAGPSVVMIVGNFTDGTFQTEASPTLPSGKVTA